jgi:hypothetical protein
MKRKENYLALLALLLALLFGLGLCLLLAHLLGLCLLALLQDICTKSLTPHANITQLLLERHCAYKQTKQ